MKWHAKVYIASKGHSQHVFPSNTMSRYAMLLSLLNGAIPMSLHWLSLLSFSSHEIQQCSVQMGNRQLDMITCLTWSHACPQCEMGPHQIKLLCAYYSIMCWEEHYWLKMSNSFKLYFNSVFDHYVQSVVQGFGSKSKWLCISFDS
jgi:hypothetical protein